MSSDSESNSFAKLSSSSDAQTVSKQHDVAECNSLSRYFTWPLNTLKKAVIQKRQLI